MYYSDKFVTTRIIGFMYIIFLKVPLSLAYDYLVTIMIITSDS